MRIGKNPLKERGKTINPPHDITVGVLSFMSSLGGYNKDSLAILKLCLHSIRQNADREFDLLVVDNGSCPEVRDYLSQQLQNGLIDILILNQHNLGKVNGMLQILHSAPGKLIFYSDGDIYFKPGWMIAHLNIMENYPHVGLVGGIPIRNLSTASTESTFKWAQNRESKAYYETGKLIPTEWLLEYYQSVGVRSKKHLDEYLRLTDHRVNINGTPAYIGASHMQFLIKKSVASFLPLPNFSEAMGMIIEAMDQHLDEEGYLRLSTATPFVYHMGNALTEDWLITEYKRLIGRTEGVDQLLRLHPLSRKRHWLWGRSKVRKMLRKLYEWSYDKYWQQYCELDV